MDQRLDFFVVSYHLTTYSWFILELLEFSAAGDPTKVTTIVTTANQNHTPTHASLESPGSRMQGDHT